MIGLTIWSSVDFSCNDIYYGTFDLVGTDLCVRVFVGVVDDAICYLGIEGGQVVCYEDLRRRYEGANFAKLTARRLAEISEIVRRGYFEGGEVRLTVRGTMFQAEVWMALCGVVFGERITYGELAQRMGRRGVRAVASAVARNPVSLLIPCHRVVRRDSPGEYFWGRDTKIRLLELESR